MGKRTLLGIVAVFIVFLILDFVVNNVILMSTYESLAEVWRPEDEMKLWLFPIIGLIFTFFFVFIFSKGYENKGIGEGFRYGLYIGLMVAIPMAYGQYAVYPIPYSLALQWFIYGLIEYIIAGMVLAIVFRKCAKEGEAA